MRSVNATDMMHKRNKHWHLIADFVFRLGFLRKGYAETFHDMLELADAVEKKSPVNMSNI